MATCKPCARGDHAKCVKRNADRTTGCPANCQHRVAETKGACAPGCDFAVTGYHAKRGGKVLCDVEAWGVIHL